MLRLPVGKQSLLGPALCSSTHSHRDDPMGWMNRLWWIPDLNPMRLASMRCIHQSSFVCSSDVVDDEFYWREISKYTQYLFLTRLTMGNVNNCASGETTFEENSLMSNRNRCFASMCFSAFRQEPTESRCCIHVCTVQRNWRRSLSRTWLPAPEPPPLQPQQPASSLSGVS
jgi:hypothetical protein